MQDVSIVTFILGVLNLLEKDCTNHLFMYYTGPFKSLYLSTICFYSKCNISYKNSFDSFIINLFFNVKSSLCPYATKLRKINFIDENVNHFNIGIVNQICIRNKLNFLHVKARKLFFIKLWKFFFGTRNSFHKNNASLNFIT